MDRAARYHRIQLALGVLSLGLDAIYLGAAVLAGVGPTLADLATSIAPGWWMQVFVVSAVLGLGQAVVSFPLGWLRGWVLPRRFGLLHQPLTGWLADRVKAAALGAVFALVVVEAIYALLQWSRLWWLWAAGALTLLSLIVATVFPVLVVPLFYRMTPLRDESLRERLLTLCERAGAPAVGVFVVNQSRKSRTANAALAGFGRTRRIILFDTLVTRFTAEEIEGVLAHELGHQVHHDMWRGAALQAGVTLATLALADRILRATADLGGVGDIADPGGVPWLALVLGALGLLAVPLVNLASRRREYAADAFAAGMTGAPALVAALERLGDLNLAERNPPRLEEILLYSHPALDRRIRALTRDVARRLE